MAVCNSVDISSSAKAEIAVNGNALITITTAKSTLKVRFNERFIIKHSPFGIKFATGIYNPNFSFSYLTNSPKLNTRHIFICANLDIVYPFNIQNDNIISLIKVQYFYITFFPNCN